MSTLRIVIVMSLTTAVLIGAELNLHDYLASIKETGMANTVGSGSIYTQSNALSEDELLSENQIKFLNSESIFGESQVDPELKAQESKNINIIGSSSPTDSNLLPDDKIGTDNVSLQNIMSAGFTNVVLQKFPFNGILFNSVDIRDFKTVAVTTNNFLLDNKQKIATSYEFLSSDADLINEIYNFLKERTTSTIGVSVNETNSFGEKSFYANFIDFPETAFVVVKKSSGVYALSHKKEYHQTISKLISLL